MSSAPKPRLYAPGPTPIPERVLAAMLRSSLHHRTPEAQALLFELRRGLARIFETEHDILLVAGTGTLGMEASVANFLSTRDRALVVSAGKFGDRWQRILAAYRVPHDTLELEWGSAARSEDVLAALDKSAYTSLLVTANETSTGTWQPLEEIAPECRRRGVLTIVDAVSSLGGARLPMDALGLDVVVAASQKALMAPPGLALVAASPSAFERAARSDLPKVYADLLEERRAQSRGFAAGTAAVPQLLALAESLRMIFEEGLDAVYARHARLARAFRAGLEALRLEVFSRSPSPTVTALSCSGALSIDALGRHLRERWGVVVGGGQDRVKGRVIRVAHAGHVDDGDILQILALIEASLVELAAPTGVDLELGAAIAAATKILAAERSLHAHPPAI